MRVKQYKFKLALSALLLAALVAPSRAPGKEKTRENSQPGGSGQLQATPEAINANSLDLAASFQPGPGITIRRLTNGPAGHMLSYYDINIFWNQQQKILFNTADHCNGKFGKNGVPNWQIVAIEPNGNDEALLVNRQPPSETTTRFDLSSDSQFASYAKRNPSPETGWDLYGFYLGDRAAIKELRITRNQYPISTNKIKTSPATLDPKRKQYIIAFSINNHLYVIQANGQGPNGKPGPQEIQLNDPEVENTFHRIRLNPKYSNLIFYRRNAKKQEALASSSPNLWVTDWSKPTEKPTLWHNQAKGVHMVWTPEGENIATAGTWTEYHVVNNQGNIIPGINPDTVKTRQIGPFGKGNPAYARIFYGSYSPDGALIAIATRPDSDDGGKLWLMNRQTGQVTYLAKSRSHGPIPCGQPRLGFFSGNRGIAFSTDNSWAEPIWKEPQVYTITGFSAP